MLKQSWNLFLYQPLLNSLLFFAVWTGSLGWAVIIVTVLLRLLLLPFSWSSLRAAVKMRQFAPELARLKKKYRHDKQGLAKAQMEFYRQKGINPAGGCLPQIIQILVLIALYQAFRQVLGSGQNLTAMAHLFYPFLHLPTAAHFSRHFWYLDLQKPDMIYLGRLPLPGIFLWGAALTQYLGDKAMMPAAAEEEKEAKRKGGTGGEMEEMMAGFQKQSVYLFPLMTLLFGFGFPSGLVLYWFVFSLLSWLQTWLAMKSLK